MAECPTCGRWRISPLDLELLAQQTPETKRRIAAKIRREIKGGDPDHLPLVSEAMIRYWQHEH